MPRSGANTARSLARSSLVRLSLMDNCERAFSGAFSSYDTYIHFFSISVHNPANSQKITEVLTASLSNVADAIQIAQKTFEEGLWSKASAQHRSLTLYVITPCSTS